MSTNREYRIRAGGHSTKRADLIKGEETKSDTTTNRNIHVADLIKGEEPKSNTTTNISIIVADLIKVD